MAFAKYPVSGGGSGTVNGPGLSTDNAIALWDGTSGNTLKNSTIIATNVATLSALQTFTDLKTFSSGLAVTGGTAAAGSLTRSGTTWTFGNGPTLTEAGALVLAQSVEAGGTSGASLSIDTNTGAGLVRVRSNNVSSSARDWGLSCDVNSIGDFGIMVSTTKNGLPTSGTIMANASTTIGWVFETRVAVNANTNQFRVNTVNTTTITIPNPAAARVYTVPDAGADTSFVMAAGTQTVAGAKTFSSAVTVSATTNQLVLGTTNTVTITSPAPAASRTYTIPDAGGAASFVMTAGTQTIGGTLTIPATVTFSGVNTLTKAGNFAHTLTTTATSNSTFPAGTHTLAALGLAQTWTAVQTYSAANTWSGGTAANLSIWAASNVLRMRGGTSGWAVDNTTGTTMSATNTGAITAGPSTTTSITGQPHVLHGGINAGATGVTDAAKRMLINVNTYQGGEAWASARDSNTNTLGGVSLNMLARTSDTTSCFSIQTNLAANGNTTATTEVFGITQAGAVTLGNTSANAKHVLQSASTSGVAQVWGYGTGGAYLQITEDGVQDWFVGMDNGSGVLKIRPSSLATASVLESTVAGALTFGASGGTALHSINTAALTTSTAAGISYLRININGATRRIPTYNDA